MAGVLPEGSIISAEGSVISKSQDVYDRSGKLCGVGYDIVKVDGVKERSPATAFYNESDVRFNFGEVALPSRILDSLCLARQSHWRLERTSAPLLAARAGCQELRGYVANNIGEERHDQRTLEAVEEFLSGWANYKVSK